MLPSRRYYLDSIWNDWIDNSHCMDIMKCDIYEKDNQYHIEVDIPGFHKEDIQIECEDGYLTISVEKSSDLEETEEKNYIQRERFYGKTTRKFYIGKVDFNQIKAEFKDGLLSLIVPKEENLDHKQTIIIP